MNQVAGQVPDDDESPDEDSSSSTSGGERCGVCSRSIRNRPIAKCAGCTKRVHKDYCVNYMRMSTTLRAGMCVMCCDKVQSWFTEIMEYATASGLTWNQEDWLRKLVKSHSRGIGLSHQTFRPFNRLQEFLWIALGRVSNKRKRKGRCQSAFFEEFATQLCVLSR